MIALAFRKFAWLIFLIASDIIFLHGYVFAQERNAPAVPSNNSDPSRIGNGSEEAIDKLAETTPQWLSIGEDYATDKNALRTTNRWLNSQFALNNGDKIEGHGGLLTVKDGNDNFHGSAIGGAIALIDTPLLRNIDAMVYQFDGADQWQDGAQFGFINNQIALQLQHNVFLWWRELSAKKLALDAHVPLGVIAADLNWQHYAVADGNTVEDTTVRVNMDDLSAPSTLHWRLGFHQRSAAFSDPDYWSPTAAETTLDLGAGLTWQQAPWQFSFSIQRNLPLNKATTASWGIDSAFSINLGADLSVTMTYASGNGWPQRDAFWWNFLSASLKWSL